MERYQVGYKRPPKSTQFQPGISGNPKGRPKDVPNLKTVLLAALAASVGKSKTTVLEAMIAGVTEKAVKEGDLGATKLLLELYLKICGSGSERGNGLHDPVDF